MKRVRRSCIFVTIVVSMVFSGTLLADVKAAIGFELTKTLAKNLNLSFEEDLRVRESLGVVERSASTLSLSYRINTYLRVGGAYRFLLYNQVNRGWERRHRFTADVSARVSAGNLVVSLRERFQSRYIPGLLETLDRPNPKNYLRSRLKLEYKIPKSGFNPYVSAELFYTLNKASGNEIDELRYVLGTEYRINRKNSLDFSYQYSQGLGIDPEETGHLITLSYGLRL